MGTATGDLARSGEPMGKEESTASRSRPEDGALVEHEPKAVSFQFQSKSFHSSCFMAGKGCLLPSRKGVMHTPPGPRGVCKT